MVLTQTELLEVARKLSIDGEFLGFEEIHSGHINSTYRAFFNQDGEKVDFILQKINTYVFQNPVEMMENIANVTEFIREKIRKTGGDEKRYVLHYQKTADGKSYYIAENGDFWRSCAFIDDSISFLTPDSMAVVEEAGKAFGEFQKYLIDFPVANLHIVIPHFHNTVLRYATFRTAIEKDLAGRKESVATVIADYFALEEVATEPYKMQKRKELPLRVTHNDTKPSNVLFDKNTLEHLSVIDLDTVMPGLVAFDFGDAIRVAGSTCDEDEQDLSKVALDMEKYEAFTRGFVGAIGGELTENEKKSLTLGAVAMTVECGMRFLTDYLDGDKYFKIHYPTQNLARAKCHLALAKDMLTKFDEMTEIVKKYCK